MKDEKSEIRWQFAEEFYKYLVEQLKRIGLLMEYYKDYEHGFGEMRQMRNNLNYTYKKFAPEIYVQIEALIPEIERLLYESKVKQIILERHDSRRLRLRMAAIDAELVSKINELHNVMMGTNDMLGMLFPREKKDEGLAIYK